MRLLAILSLLTVAGCFDPDEPACTFSCTPGGACPTDYMCLPDGYCHLGGKPGNCGYSDAAVPLIPDAGDMSIADLMPPMDDGPSPDLLPPPDLMPLPTCSNGVIDTGETDIDCGGPCAPALKCADTKGCLVNGDCTNGYCRLSDHTCARPPAATRSRTAPKRTPTAAARARRRRSARSTRCARPAPTASADRARPACASRPAPTR